MLAFRFGVNGFCKKFCNRICVTITLQTVGKHQTNIYIGHINLVPALFVGFVFAAKGNVL